MPECTLVASLLATPPFAPLPLELLRRLCAPLREVAQLIGLWPRSAIVFAPFWLQGMMTGLPASYSGELDALRRRVRRGRPSTDAFERPWACELTQTYQPILSSNIRLEVSKHPNVAPE